MKEAALKIIEDSVVLKEDKDKTGEWIKAMLEELRTRASSLGGTYEAEMENVNSLIHKIERILNA